MNDADFCKKLEELCSFRRWTCADLARLTKLTARSCSDYLHGNTPPSYKFLMGLRDAGVDMGNLLGLETRHADQAVPVEAVIAQAAQYKATLDAISTVLNTIHFNKAVASTPEEEALLLTFRTASASQRALFKAICDSGKGAADESPGLAP